MVNSVQNQQVLLSQHTNKTIENHTKIQVTCKKRIELNENQKQKVNLKHYRIKLVV